MKTVIVSYSLTGNNCALAQNLAEKAGVEHVEVRTLKKFGMGTLLMDIIFKRAPKVEPSPEILDEFENIIFMGPLWMGQAATPLRSYFAYLKGSSKKYSFISVCGGAKDGNQNLEEQFIQRIGYAPEHLLELHTANLVDESVKQDIKATTDYKLTDEDVKLFVNQVMKALALTA